MINHIEYTQKLRLKLWILAVAVAFCAVTTIVLEYRASDAEERIAHLERILKVRRSSVDARPNKPPRARCERCGSPWGWSRHKPTPRVRNEKPHEGPGYDANGSPVW
jgi:hypothetical protein